MPQVQVMIPYSEVYGEPWSFDLLRSLVATISRTDALIWCARLNLVLANPNVPHVAAQETAMSCFLGLSEIERVQRFAAKHGGANGVAVFGRAQLLEALRWVSLLAADLPGDGTTFEDPAVRRVFAQVLLIAAEIWLARVYRNGLPNSGDLHADRIAAMPFTRQAIALMTPALNVNVALARSRGIYDAAFRRFPGGIRAFELATGMTLDEYLACVYGFACDLPNYTPEKMDGKNGIFDENDWGPDVTEQGRAILRRFIATEAQTMDQLGDALGRRTLLPDLLDGTEPFDYKPLRQRPILRVGDGRGIVIDPGLLMERAVTGPLFIAAQQLHGTGAANTVFGAFGDGFEDYMNLLLSHAYPPAPSEVFKAKPIGRWVADGRDIELADGALDQGKQAVLFEAKAAFLRDGICDAHDYKKLLREKYGVSAGSERDRPVKGVGQLARAVVGLAVGSLESDALRTAALEVIYPVLVVHDAALSAPGHADFFAAEFEAAVVPDHRFKTGHMRKGTLVVAPLTVMTIDDLEAHQSSIERFRLVDFLRDYANLGADAGRASLKDFMAGSTKYGYIHSRVTGELSIDAIQRSARLLFGRAIVVPE